jgi:hypothetical protein
MDSNQPINQERKKMTIINQPTNTKIANAIQGLHPDWFSKKTMDFWNSEIYWQTLTQTKDGWHFITSESNFDGQATRYTIRRAYDETLEEVGAFQEYATLGEAVRALEKIHETQVAWSTRHLKK